MWLVIKGLYSDLKAQVLYLGSLSHSLFQSIGQERILSLLRTKSKEQHPTARTKQRQETDGYSSKI